MKISLRIWILIIVLALSLLAIVNFEVLSHSGVQVSGVEENSTALEYGFKTGQIITEIDNKKISSLDEYSKIISDKFPSEDSVKTIFKLKDSEIIFFSKTAPQISVSEISSTHIKAGLELAGGSRALVQAKNHGLTSSEVKDLANVLQERLNVYGIQDVKISPAKDLEGNQRVLIEIAGATPDDLKELISQQGKFEAKIGNETVFTGGDRDISSVSRNPPEAVVESCDEQNGEHFCSFRFTIYLTEQAAKNHANITSGIAINESNPEYLEKPLDLYLDDTLVDSLFISEGLKGRVTTQISISGSGQGTTRDEAYESAQQQMNKLQTILITGSLPYKLEIAKLDTISPILGKDFVKSILIAGFSALIAVSLIVFFRYRKLKPSLALIFTSISEIVIILGVSTLFGVDYNLPAIAGILATIGTGIDQQIIIIDETSQKQNHLSIKQKMKRAFAIILGAYFTVLVAMLPLLQAGGGLLKGFAITTIIGVTAGVLITRPAFSDMVKNFENK